MKQWILRISLGLLSLLLLAVIVGTTYETFHRRQIRNEFPPAGTMVDIGGRRIQLDCRGSGSPTVVFESGLDMNGSLGWYAVHDAIAKTTRACAYCRAGMVWSDPSDGPRNGKAIADDLHVALERAGEHAPFVLVGHSMGGPLVTIYTKYYSSQVAGLVLVDPTPPDLAQRMKAIMQLDILTLGQEPMKWAGRVAWTGILRISNTVDKTDAKPMQIATMFEPTSLNSFNKEWVAAPETRADAGTFRNFGARPLVVMTATGHTHQRCWKRWESQQSKIRK